MTNPFNSLVLLSSPVEAVMSEELRSFSAKATPTTQHRKTTESAFKHCANNIPISGYYMQPF